MLTKSAVLDLELVEQIRKEVSVPLVLHGSSGVPDDVLIAAVRSGLTKINIATALNKVFTGSVRAALAGDERLVDPRKYMAAGREAVAEEVARLLAVLASP
jgi:fructose-bisphosphate aldolase class II